MKTKNTRIGFLGPSGSFSEEAAHKISATEYLPFSSIPELLQVFWDKKVDKAVSPLENSFGGIVGHTIDGLIVENGNNFFIEGEIILPISQNLIGIGEISEIKKVISHPQALAQCIKFTEKLGIEIESSSSTSVAVKSVADSDNPEIAAIGTRRAAEIYGLKILAENIQDFENNVTRFIVLGRNVGDPTGNDKTSLVFEVFENKAGALLDVLEVFRTLEINMTKLISRPLKTGLDDDVFWVTIDGHQNDKKVNGALKQIKTKTKFLKILGSYPKSNWGV